MLDSRFDFTPRNCAGFTLVELLVVVLILCILVSVALPMYNRAIAKTRASQLLIAMNSVLKGGEVYFMTHNKYAMDIAFLNIKFSNLPKKNVNHLMESQIVDMARHMGLICRLFIPILRKEMLL